MYQLTYRSTSAPGIKEEHLDQIFEESRNRNLKKNLTGCVVYYKNNFVQILEGDKQGVLKLYNKIKLDHRHHTIQLLWEGNVKERYFPNWGMAYCQRSKTLPTDSGEKLFIQNLLLLGELTSISSGSLASFWGTVRKLLDDRSGLGSF
ncbi:BLUF domain-containing protein [Maribacter sp. Hel_I_7]|uniref:BLUF domain-containing protein n=1 Tax=Maribacter sp. Hel_I_7 TaxID=1249997 RepID=UPI00068D377D|nr:BLUF domain-containing protein [Maribacter sp. Hel_I_7]